MKCSVQPYEGKEPYIFISYSHKDRAKVYTIMEELSRRGFRIWYDEGIEWGTEWPETIANHLANCGILMFFVSPNSMASNNCRQEVNFAIDAHKSILSVYIEETELTPGMKLRLSSFQSTFFFKSNTNAEKEMFYKRLTDTISAKKCSINGQVSQSGAQNNQPVKMSAKRRKELMRELGTCRTEMNNILNTVPTNKQKARLKKLLNQNIDISRQLGLNNKISKYEKYLSLSESDAKAGYEADYENCRRKLNSLISLPDDGKISKQVEALYMRMEKLGKMLDKKDDLTKYREYYEDADRRKRYDDDRELYDAYIEELKSILSRSVKKTGASKINQLCSKAELIGKKLGIKSDASKYLTYFYRRRRYNDYLKDLDKLMTTSLTRDQIRTLIVHRRNLKTLGDELGIKTDLSKYDKYLSEQKNNS